MHRQRLAAAGDVRSPTVDRRPSARNCGCAPASSGNCTDRPRCGAHPSTAWLPRCAPGGPAAEKGSGRNSTAFTTLKMAVFAPIPSASVSTATMLNAGLRRSRRTPYRRSWPNCSTTAQLDISCIASFTAVRLPKARRAARASAAFFGLQFQMGAQLPFEVVFPGFSAPTHIDGRYSTIVDAVSSGGLGGSV